MNRAQQPLGPTSATLLLGDAKPYFLWWSDCTVAELRQHLVSADPTERAYWLGALLREANTRDVWLFTSPAAIREQWPYLRRHLGRSLEMWAWLLAVQDLVHEPLPDLEPPHRVEAALVQSLTDLRASKLTCLLSRAEPRDLVDVLFLERAGFRAEDDLGRAAQKDAGIDPGVLAWLLRDFPTQPLPMMLEPLSIEELLAFRDDLAGRLRSLSLPVE